MRKIPVRCDGDRYRARQGKRKREKRGGEMLARGRLRQRERGERETETGRRREREREINERDFFENASGRFEPRYIYIYL